MFSKITESVRSFVSGDTKEPSRKRSRDSYEDDLLEVGDTPKRSRLDIWENQKDESWTSTVFPLGRVAEWIVKKKYNFNDNYYFRKIVESPSRLMKKFTGISSSKQMTNGDHGPPTVQPMGIRSTGSQGKKGNVHFSIATGVPTITQPQPPPGMASTPKKVPEVPTASTSSHMGGYPPPKVGYADLPYPFVIPEISRGPDEFHYRMSHVRTSAGHDTHPGPGRFQFSSHSRDGAPGGSPRHGYRSMYDKTFNSSGGSFNNTTINRGRNKLAVKQSIRLEEKNRYAQLLQQFTCTPLTGTAFGNSYLRKMHVPPVRTGVEEKTPLGTDMSRIQDIASPSSAETPVVSPKQYYSPNKTLSPAKSAGMTDRSFQTIQARRSKQEEGRRSPDVIVLDSDEEQQKVIAPGKSPGAVCGRPTMDKLPSPKPAEVVALDKSLKENKYASEDWIHDLSGKYSIEKRRRQREIKEEEVKCSFFKEKREEWEHMLEQKLRKRLSLAEREPPVLEEDYEEEKEEEEEFPELSGEMEELIHNALYPHPPHQVLAEAFRLQIKRCDMNTLAGLNWLNDEVINFYMELLKDRGTQEGFPSVHVFNTFFYPKLMNGGHSALKRWTKKVDIFAVDYIIIPVHLGMHWCLAVVDMKKKEIRYYDSMGGTNNACLNGLREYLRQEHLVKKSAELDMSQWKLISMKNIPQQMNGSDCGVFTCKFAEYVSRGANITFTQEHMPYFRQRMVYEILTTKLL